MAAEDAAQETFIRVYKGLNSFDNRRSFSTWILSIAAHYSIDQMRKKQINATSTQDLPFEEIQDPTPNPEATLSDREKERQIRLLLFSLNPTDRAATVMYYWYDLSYEEISKALNLTESAVKSRLHRARVEMAKHWRTEDQPLVTAGKQKYESPAI